MRVPGIVAFCTAAALALPAAHADSLSYRNDRYGTRVTFPAEIFDRRLPVPDNGDGMRWRAGDGAELAVYASNNVARRSPADFLKDAAWAADASHRVTYSRAGRDWAVLSGLEGDGAREIVFYERHLFTRDGVIHSVRLTYPKGLSGKYDALAGPIASSLAAP